MPSYRTWISLVRLATTALLTGASQGLREDITRNATSVISPQLETCLRLSLDASQARSCLIK
eukprot:scaffold49647_cov36-Tisochrysis_lutea.AAC.1